MGDGDEDTGSFTAGIGATIIMRDMEAIALTTTFGVVGEAPGDATAARQGCASHRKVLSGHRVHSARADAANACRKLAERCRARRRSTHAATLINAPCQRKWISVRPSGSTQGKRRM